MEIYIVKIIEPKVKDLLENLENLNLIKIKKDDRAWELFSDESLVGSLENLGEIIDENLELGPEILYRKTNRFELPSFNKGIGEISPAELNKMSEDFEDEPQQQPNYGED